jgi:hypothetical protein
MDERGEEQASCENASRSLLQVERPTTGKSLLRTNSAGSGCIIVRVDFSGHDCCHLRRTLIAHSRFPSILGIRSIIEPPTPAS